MPPVKKCKKSQAPVARRKQALSSRSGRQVQLNRTLFQTSREMDFFSKKELVTQTGHEVAEWPFVMLKELVDNALDACEEADVSPVVVVTADATGISVRDNGPGLPEATLEAALDYKVRASNREAYTAPCRGAQGNALKTLFPMPNVLDPDHGRLVIRTNGKQHSIVCRADPISQRPTIFRDESALRKCKESRSRNAEKAGFKLGTEVRLEWSERSAGSVWPFDGLELNAAFEQQFRAMVEGFAVFNPHGTFVLDWFRARTVWEATDTAWEKWKPNKPTSSHWYDLPRLGRLVAAYITHDRDAGTDRPVSDFVAEFDGLSGSQKRTKVLDESGLKRVKLLEFVVGDRLDESRIAKLLAAMQRHTRRIKPKRLGVIGEDHLRTRLLAMGVQQESFGYSLRLAKEGLPWVLELAFGWLGDESEDSRKIVTGANWSVAIKNPFRSFGSTGEGLETLLADSRATRDEPVVFILHLAHPSHRIRRSRKIGSNHQGVVDDRQRGH